MISVQDALDCIPGWIENMKDELSHTSKQHLTDIYNLFFDVGKDERKQLGDGLAEAGAGKIFAKQMQLMHEEDLAIPAQGTEKFDCLDILRSLCWNYTHVSIKLCLQLGEACSFPLLVSDLQTCPLQTGLKNPVVRPCLSILHNCAKVPGNREFLRKANAKKALIPILKIQNEEFLKHKVIAILALSYIVDDRDKDILSLSEGMIIFIIQNLEKAVEKENHQYEGFSAKEFVDGLTNLAGNADNKELMVKKRLIPLLAKLLEVGDASEKTSSCAALWALSLSPRNKVKIRESKCRELLERVVKESEPMQSKNAEGALWCLYKEDEHLQAQKEDEKIRKKELPNSSKDGHIMISYQWSHQGIVLKIKKRLEKLGYPIWIDVEQMTGSTLDAMAKAVQGSRLVIICISPEYNNSQACRTEAEYAYKKKISIIPVKMTGGYDPDGWLGAIMASKLYFDFGGNEKFDDVFRRLEREVKSNW